MFAFSFMSWVKEKGIRKEYGSQIVLTIYTEGFASVLVLVAKVHFTFWEYSYQ